MHQGGESPVPGFRAMLAQPLRTHDIRRQPLRAGVSEETDVTDNRGVSVFYDERMLAHYPDTNVDFLAGRLDKQVRAILSGLDVMAA